MPDSHFIDANFNAEQGQFKLQVGFMSTGLSTAVFGHSGAGKTSLINAIAGVTKPVSGHIKVADTVFYDSAQAINLSVEERRVGLVFQDARLFPHMSVEKNLTYGQWAGKRQSNLDLDEIAKLLDLKELLTRRPKHLSGGEKQRVAMGRALMSGPRILLLDEPLASLDNARKQEILPYLERLAVSANIPILYVTHSMDEVTRLADDLVVLSRGKTVAFGPLHDVLGRVDLGNSAGRHEASAILDAKVTAHNDEKMLTRLSLGGEDDLYFEVARSELKLDTVLRLRIRARDVAIATSPVEGISIRNQLPGIIDKFKTDENGYTEIALKLGQSGQGPILRARITAASFDELGLEIGQPVYALVKSIAIERRLIQPIGLRPKSQKKVTLLNTYAQPATKVAPTELEENTALKKDQVNPFLTPDDRKNNPFLID